MHDGTPSAHAFLLVREPESDLPEATCLLAQNGGRWRASPCARAAWRSSCARLHTCSREGPDQTTWTGATGNFSLVWLREQPARLHARRGDRSISREILAHQGDLELGALVLLGRAVEPGAE